jgi:ketosteroid isomerase-like protein
LPQKESSQASSEHIISIFEVLLELNNYITTKLSSMDLKIRQTPATTLLLLTMILNSCQSKVDPVLEANNLLAVDREFSKHSADLGANTAFLDYVDDSAVLLRANRYPVVGVEKIIEIFDKPDTGFVLTWEPAFALVSKSGDLGYTYGIYKTEIKSPTGDPVISQGTYVTIWKKDANGKWKFMLDTGNPGLERKKPDLE